MNTTLTPADILAEAEALSVAPKQKKETWFNPLDPLIEPVAELDFLIEGFCARGMITLYGGGAGSGKSITTQSFFSRADDEILPTQKKIKAIYLTGADSSDIEIRRRARAIKVNNSLLTVTLPDEMFCTATNQVFMSELTREVLSQKADVVIFDTLADFHEGNTYEAELANNTMRAFRKLAADTNAAIILITHTRKGSKIKSRYDVEDISDSRIFATKSDFVFGLRSEYQDDSTNLVELQCLKSRSPRPLKPLRMIIRYDHGLIIERTSRPFQNELEEADKNGRKQARIDEAQRLQKKGKTVREIADSLGIATGTAHKYLKADPDTFIPKYQYPESYQ